MSAGAALASSRDASEVTKAPAFRLQRLAHVDPGSPAADVYGHRRHAYLSSYRGATCPAAGVRVYDLRTATRPRLVSTFADRDSDPSLAGTDTQKTIVKQVATPRFTGDLAVTGFQRCGGTPAGTFEGFGVYDVTDPRQPKKLALVRTAPRGVHELWLQATGNRAYVYVAIPGSELVSSPDRNPQTGAARTPGEPDFRIYDVTDPRDPVRVGEWGAWRTLGVHPADGRGASKANIVHSVITNQAATRAFLSYWDLGTVILDISNPARPTYLGRTTFAAGEEGDAHSVALGRSGKLMIETHESPRRGFPTLFDISNPRKPRRLGRFVLRAAAQAQDASFLNGVHDPKILGNRAYFSWYRQGVVVADISRPAKPRLVAQFVPPNAPQVWGIFVERDYVLASDMESGLWVLRLRPKR